MGTIHLHTMTSFVPQRNEIIALIVKNSRTWNKKLKWFYLAHNLA